MNGDYGEFDECYDDPPDPPEDPEGCLMHFILFRCKNRQYEIECDPSDEAEVKGAAKALSVMEALAINLESVGAVSWNEETPFPKEYKHIWKKRGFEIVQPGCLYINYDRGTYTYPLNVKVI